MIIEEQILVDAPVSEVWSLIDKLESVIPCVPGATYEGQEGDDHLVAVRVRIGVISASFKGRMRFIEKDSATHRAVIEGSGRDAGGKGSARANIIGALEAAGANQTRMRATVDLSMTGRIAQFGGPIVADIAKQIVTQFSINLQERLLGKGDAPEQGRPLTNPLTDAPKSGASVPAAEISLGRFAVSHFKYPIMISVGLLALAVIGIAVYS